MNLIAEQKVAKIVLAPLISVILGSVLVYLTHAEKHGVPVVSHPFINHDFLHVLLLFNLCTVGRD